MQKNLSSILTDALFYKFIFTIFTAYSLAIITFLYFDIYKKNRTFLKKIQKKTASSSAIWFEFYWSITSLCVWLLLAGAMIFLIQEGKTKIYFDITEHGWGYLFFTSIIVIILHDTFFYWGHRFMHINNFIYTLFHKVHHHSVNPTALSIFSFAPTEGILLGSFAFLIAYLFPIHISTLLMIFSLNTLANILGHMGYYVFPKKILGITLKKYLFTEVQHNKHHQNGDTNFGAYFSFWDNIMHTKK